jgi:hypothetical protein
MAAPSPRRAGARRKDPTTLPVVNVKRAVGKDFPFVISHFSLDIETHARCVSLSGAWATLLNDK